MGIACIQRGRYEKDTCSFFSSPFSFNSWRIFSSFSPSNAGQADATPSVKEDAWESPVFSEEDMKKILALGIDGSRFQEKEENGQKIY